MLKIQNISTYYGQVQALHEVSLEVKENEIVSLIGANGAGKTTLLRSVSGLMSNAAAQVVYCGTPIGALRADEIAALGIALVPEGRQLFPSLSVEENLLIGGRLNREGPWSLSAVFELFPVLKERRAYPSTALSGGQQQMVAIGRAMMSNPTILTLDEPSLGLSPLLSKELFQNLARVRDLGIGVLMVEQNAKQALNIADKGYVLVQGRNRYTDTGEALIADPEVRKAFLGG